jgi:glycosyltransferase involved in cell wall biosynthesis
MKRLNVLRIVSRLNIGGPSIHCAILTEGLNPERFATKLLTGTISLHEGDMSYLIGETDGHLIKVPELQREIDIIKDIKAFIRILQIIFIEKPDIVHTHMAKAGAISRVVVFFHNILFPRKPIFCVHTYHGHVLEGYFSPFISSIFIGIEKMLARITDAIIAISQTQKWELTKKYKLTDPEKVHVINLGFDLTRLINLEGEGIFRSSIGADDKSYLIGIIGRLTPIKNHYLFIDSAKLVLERFPDKSILFVIVGDGELRRELENYAVSIGAANKVIFYGWEKNIKNVYADLDLLVLTSNNEGTPVSIIESMASSVPVVTTCVGGVKDLLGRIEVKLKNKMTCSICERGVLCTKGNPEAVASGIAYSIVNDNYIRTSKAKSFVMEKYSDKQLIDKIEKLYYKLTRSCI